MKIRPITGGYLESMSKMETVNTKSHLIDFLRRYHAYNLPDSAVITATRYQHDTRCGWDTYLVEVNGCAAAFSDGPLVVCTTPDKLTAAESKLTRIRSVVQAAQAALYSAARVEREILSILDEP